MKGAALAASCLLAAFAGASLGGCTDAPMKQSVTYVHLLRKTPFFTALDSRQLNWVIGHSTEWEVAPGTEISNRLDAGEHFWVLLDGGWQVEQGGRAYPAGHADPAKWYGGVQVAMLPADSRLVVTKHSYVMRIKRTDFEQMRQQGYAFDTHLQQGQVFYSHLAR